MLRAIVLLKIGKKVTQLNKFCAYVKASRLFNTHVDFDKSVSLGEVVSGFWTP